jgi:hypothetical protein
MTVNHVPRTSIIANRASLRSLLSSPQLSRHRLKSSIALRSFLVHPTVRLIFSVETTDNCELLDKSTFLEHESSTLRFRSAKPQSMLKLDWYGNVSLVKVPRNVASDRGNCIRYDMALFVLEVALGSIHRLCQSCWTSSFPLGSKTYWQSTNRLVSEVNILSKTECKHTGGS